MLGSLQTHFWAVREYLSPVLRESKFKETGRLTPDEFVAAGDFLVYKFPTWKWESGEPSKRRDYLPADKQYLVQRGVPCLRRASQLANEARDEDEQLLSFALEGADGDDEEWVSTHTSRATAGESIADIPDIEDDEDKGITNDMAQASLQDDIPDMDEIPDIEDEDAIGGGLVDVKDDAEARPSRSNLLSVRTYDCSVTYDKYYQTPRMWLLGYDEHKRPLPPKTALEDVSSEHALKTVTIEPFPHSSLSMASVHPCKHSSVMKKVIERMDEKVVKLQRTEASTASGSSGGSAGRRWGLPGRSKKKEDDGKKASDDGPEGLRVDQYLVVFLKFMSTIVPTIEVDATNAIVIALLDDEHEDGDCSGGESNERPIKESSKRARVRSKSSSIEEGGPQPERICRRLQDIAAFVKWEQDCKDLVQQCKDQKKDEIRRRLLALDQGWVEEDFDSEWARDAPKAVSQHSPLTDGSFSRMLPNLIRWRSEKREKRRQFEARDKDERPLVVGCRMRPRVFEKVYKEYEARRANAGLRMPFFAFLVLDAVRPLWSGLQDEMEIVVTEELLQPILAQADEAVAVCERTVLDQLRAYVKEMQNKIPEMDELVSRLPEALRTDSVLTASECDRIWANGSSVRIFQRAGCGAFTLNVLKKRLQTSKEYHPRESLQLDSFDEGKIEQYARWGSQAHVNFDGFFQFAEEKRRRYGVGWLEHLRHLLRVE